MLPSNADAAAVVDDDRRPWEPPFDASKPAPPISYPITDLTALASSAYLSEAANFHLPFNRASTPLPSPGAPLPARPRALVCHDMQGGYCDDAVPQGGTNPDAYAIWHWYLIDVFVYFSHYLVTLPPPCWTNTAHLHGVKVLGTFITEGDKGAEICKKVLATEASAQMYAERLTELAATLGFDGWLMNIEVDLDIQFIDNLKEFIKHLTKTMHDAVPGFLVIWYDAITVNGDLAWQNKLNEYNKPFFDLCDGFFSNYSWTEKDPEDSAAVAGDRKYDVYMGIDVFGRNTFGGGQWNETSLELVVVGDDGVLQSICEQTTFGIIKDIGVLDWRYTHFGLMPKIEGKEILVVLSDSGKLSLLYFCSEMHRFFAVANIELSEPGNLRHQLGRILAIDRDFRDRGFARPGGRSSSPGPARWRIRINQNR